jgi:two-component system OmpR family sensor kinase
MRSIRRELLLWLLLGLVVAVVAAATSTYYRARHEARELFDYQLRQLALSVSSQRVSLVPEAQGNNRDEDFVIQIWDRDQKLFFSSRPEAQIPFQPVAGYAFVATPVGRWRVYGMRDRDRLIQTAQSLKVWEELAAGMALRVVWPLLVILPLLGALVFLTVYRGLRPLMSVTRAVRARTPAALQPLPESDLPEEVQPLVHALNTSSDASGARSRRKRASSPMLHTSCARRSRPFSSSWKRRDWRRPPKSAKPPSTICSAESCAPFTWSASY